MRPTICPVTASGVAVGLSLCVCLFLFVLLSTFVFMSPTPSIGVRFLARVLPPFFVGGPPVAPG